MKDFVTVKTLGEAIKHELIVNHLELVKAAHVEGYDYCKSDDEEVVARNYYILEEDDDSPICNHDFRVFALTDYGGSEGIYIVLFIEGNTWSHNKEIKRRPLLTLKTLEEDDSAMQAMFSLACSVQLVANKKVRELWNQFDRDGFRLLEPSGRPLSMFIFGSQKEAEEYAKEQGINSYVVFDQYAWKEVARQECQTLLPPYSGSRLTAKRHHDCMVAMMYYSGHSVPDHDVDYLLAEARKFDVVREIVDKTSGECYVVAYGTHDGVTNYYGANVRTGEFVTSELAQEIYHFAGGKYKWYNR